ncbi:MAG: hypothetical protein EOP31_31145, partial [Rhodococcus sp. (in: high G+C Gram-positive bacteria)]
APRLCPLPPDTRAAGETEEHHRLDRRHHRSARLRLRMHSRRPPRRMDPAPHRLHPRHRRTMPIRQSQRHKHRCDHRRDRWHPCRFHRLLHRGHRCCRRSIQRIRPIGSRTQFHQWVRGERQ